MASNCAGVPLLDRIPWACEHLIVHQIILSRIPLSMTGVEAVLSY
jgi:hypothetical protein